MQRSYVTTENGLRHHTVTIATKTILLLMCKNVTLFRYTPSGNRGEVEIQLYSFFNLGARCEWVVNATPRPLYPSDPVPIVQEAG